MRIVLVSAAALLLVPSAGAQAATSNFKVDSLSENGNPFKVDRGQVTNPPFRVRSFDPTTTVCQITVQYGPTGGVAETLKAVPDANGVASFTWTVDPKKATLGIGKGMGGYCYAKGGKIGYMNGMSQASHPIEVK
jgi:hypothetical protein